MHFLRKVACVQNGHFRETVLSFIDVPRPLSPPTLTPAPRRPGTGLRRLRFTPWRLVQRTDINNRYLHRYFVRVAQQCSSITTETGSELDSSQSRFQRDSSTQSCSECGSAGQVQECCGFKMTGKTGMFGF